MNEEKNLAWVNKKTGQIATKSELKEMWTNPKHNLELKNTEQNKINDSKNSEQNLIILDNNSDVRINETTQIILGLLSPLVITSLLLILFPPCLFWCSPDEGGLNPGSLLCCHFLFIMAGFVNSAPKYSISFIISIIPSAYLSFYLWAFVI